MVGVELLATSYTPFWIVGAVAIVLILLVAKVLD